MGLSLESLRGLAQSGKTRTVPVSSSPPEWGCEARPNPSGTRIPTRDILLPIEEGFSMASPRMTPLLQRERAGNGNGLHDELDRTAIREQVDRILASPVFRNSRRNSSLLRHVVERALEGRPEELKERSIGVDVFGRAANYDTNIDHVVRSVAGEVRRRLAQYYMEPGREAEIRIDLLAGSYIPQFRLPAERPVRIPAVAPVFPSDTAHASWIERLPGRRILPIAVAAFLLVALFSILAFRFFTPTTPLEMFWRPFLSSSSPAM